MGKHRILLRKMPNKPPANKIKEKHVERLLLGKKSGINIGSRNVPHHLYAYERETFERAIKFRFLTVSDRERPNLENIWQKYCIAKDWDYIVLKKTEDGQGHIYKNKLLQEILPLKEAKQKLIDQLK